MSQTSSTHPTNRLADETSLYLRQHMNNPVDWYPWGPEALERARSEDKPLLISIGYSACHWCHVMERESFEDSRTAALMNAEFVCIKVDREERPDVDQIYMDAVTRFVGRGGWPLTVFCKSDGQPFYGGTYFPPTPRHGMPAFTDLLRQISSAYRDRRDDVDNTAEKLLGAVGWRPEGSSTGAAASAIAAAAAQGLMQSADRRHGGFGGAPKFPTPPSLELLLAASDTLPENEAAEAVAHVAFSCVSMSRGGLYDQLGGGFHRYSVDGHWGVPHFEKMLYDQGQLLRVYAETWRRCGDEAMLWPIRETVAFLRRDMAAADGGLYASLDADSEGIEGKYYAWTPEEVDAVLGESRGPEFCAAYDVTTHGNFENDWTVLREIGDAPRSEFGPEREQLLEVRARRIAPATDTKRLSAWNGLAISGLARAGSLLDDASMLDDAARTADFLLERCIDPKGRLLRMYDSGQASVPGFLDDLAAVLEACLDLYRAGAGDRYLAAAFRFADDIVERFFDADEGDFFLTPHDGERLFTRPRTDHDGATPQSTGLATLGLVRAAALAERESWSNAVERVLATHAFAMERAPEAFPTLARAALAAERGISVALIVPGEDDSGARELATRARRALRPEDGVIVMPAPSGVSGHWTLGRTAIDGRSTAYLCHGTSCSAPTHDPDELAALC